MPSQHHWSQAKLFASVLKQCLSAPFLTNGYASGQPSSATTTVAVAERAMATARAAALTLARLAITLGTRLFNVRVFLPISPLLASPLAYETIDKQASDQTQARNANVRKQKACTVLNPSRRRLCVPVLRGADTFCTFFCNWMH